MYVGKSAAAYTAAALPLPTPPRRCRRCHRHALAKLLLPPPSWPPRGMCSHHASAAAIAFVSIVIVIAVIVVAVIVAVSVLLVD